MSENESGRRSRWAVPDADAKTVRGSVVQLGTSIVSHQSHNKAAISRVTKDFEVKDPRSQMSQKYMS